MSDPIVTSGESAIKNESEDLVRQTVEDAINALLEEEADALVGAERYGRTADREACRAGHYDRKSATASGVVNIEMPKPKGARFVTAIIERYKRREASVEEAVAGMYPAGASTRRIEDVGEILWGASVSAGTVSDLNEKAFESIGEWRSRPLEKEYRYVYIDGIYLKRSWGGSFENVAVMVAIGVNGEGYREVIGCAEGFTESKECWAEFLSWLKSRGLRGVRMLTGDKGSGMVGALDEVFPDAKYRRCTVRFYGNVLAKVPESKRSQAAAMLKAIHARESKDASEEKARAVVSKLEEIELVEAAKAVRNGITETPAYTTYPWSTGRRPGPTMPSRGSTARSGEGRGWSALPLMANQPSCLLPRASSTLPTANGDRGDIRTYHRSKHDHADAMHRGFRKSAQNY